MLPRFVRRTETKGTACTCSVRDKKLLLLDEPVTGLDPIVTGEFYQLLCKINREQKIAVVMVSHDVESAVEYASHVLHLSEDTQFFGTAAAYQKSRAGKTFLGGEAYV